MHDELSNNHFGLCLKKQIIVIETVISINFCCWFIQHRISDSFVDRMSVSNAIGLSSGSAYETAL